MKLSIIVPVYNVEKYIERCLRSLLNQELSKNEYEIIVVDDGTPDHSAEIAQSIAEECDNMIVIHRENGGLSAARNTGLEHVHGKYVFFLDSDDYIEPNVLSQLIDSAENRDLELLAFSLRRQNNDTQTIRVHTFNDYIGNDTVTDGFSLLRKGFLPTSACTYLYLVETLNKFHFRFKEGIIHEDIEFNYRVFTKIDRVGAIDLLVYNYCMNDEQSITNGRTLKQESNALICNMKVAASIKSFIRHENIPHDIFCIYDNVMNSILVSQIILLFRRKGRRQPIDFVQQYITLSKELNVYPIKGYNNKLHTKIARSLINIEPLLMCFFKISRI